MGSKKSALSLHAELVEQNRLHEQQIENDLKYVTGADGKPISVQDTAAIRANIRATGS